MQREDVMFSLFLYTILMRYFVNKTHEFNSDKYQKAPIEDVKTYLTNLSEVSLDTETEGFDPHTCKTLCIQVGDKENQYVIDAGSEDLLQLKPLLEEKLIIGHNLKFDLKFLYKLGIFPRKIHDTFVTEKVLNCGIPDIRAALDAVVYRRLGVTLDKSIRGNIHKEGLSERVIVYAADDITYLPDIKEQQLKELREKELMGVMNLENKFTPALAYIEYCGFHLNKPKWEAKMKSDNVELEQAELGLNDWVLTNGYSDFVEKQLDMFRPPICTINWGSPKQVTEFFETLGIDCTVDTKAGPKKSVEASVLEKQSVEFPLIKQYLRYKAAQKVVGTYGMSFIKQINPVTGRIHTNFTQIMDTGRISSGGKNRQTGEEYINFQNIPGDKETRACFTAEPGNVLIISDYSGQEQIVLANKALDKNLLQFYDQGLADMHSFVASKMYPELEGLTLDEIKAQHKDKRQEAKIAGFAINYGGVGQTIADQLGKTKEDGDRVYDAYFQAFPGLKAYFDKVRKEGVNAGYILISEVTKRKSYLPYLSQFRELEAKMTKEFWGAYREAKKSAPGSSEFREMKQQVSDYFYFKGEIERKSLNFPIQGSSAEITKISCAYIYRWILDNNLFGVVKFVNTVHDENVLECPEHMKDEVAEVVKDAMCKAGEIFCKRVPLKAVPDINPFWRK